MFTHAPSQIDILSGITFLKKSISKHRIFYIYSGSRDRNHKGTYTELQCKLTAVTHLGKNKI